MAVIEGTRSDDRLVGTSLADEILGKGRNDILLGRRGDDKLKGGNGNDELKGGGGNDELRGGRGEDTLDGGNGRDKLRGGKDDDILVGSRGNDTLNGNEDMDTADYSNLGQAITLERAGIIDKGSAGTDQIFNIETIIGAVGQANAIDGSTGTSGVTSFDVNLSAQTLTVQNIPVLGDQEFTVENFVNVTGTSNADEITGDSNDNRLDGEGGKDTLEGGSGNDRLLGRAGADRLIGVDPGSATPGSGEIDILNGGGGADTIVLGDGTNVFYSSSSNSDFADIRGFKTGTDEIELTGAISDYSFIDGNTAIILNDGLDLIATFTNGAFNPAADIMFV